MGVDENSREKLARMVIDRVRAEGGTDPWFDDESFAVRYGDDSVLGLDDLYEETAESTELDREAHVAHFVATSITSMDWPGTWNDALPQLRPILKPSAYTLGSPTGLLLSRRVFPLVDELVVVETPTTRTVVSWTTIESWGVDPATVFAAARSNLATLTQHADPTKGRAVQRLTDDPAAGRVGRYFTSWLLDSGWLASHQARLRCAPIAFVPDVDTIYVVPADDPELLATHFHMMEQQYMHTSRGLSPQGYTVDESGAIVTVDQVHPEDPGAARARCVHIAKESAAQASWLEAQFQLDGVRSRVGTVTVKTTQYGPRTVTIWADDAPAAMPHTDLVAFCRGDDAPFYVQFSDVAALTGLTPISGLDPQRYDAQPWPSEDTLEQLRAHSISVD